MPAKSAEVPVAEHARLVRAKSRKPLNMVRYPAEPPFANAIMAVDELASQRADLLAALKDEHLGDPSLEPAGGCETCALIRRAEGKE